MEPDITLLQFTARATMAVAIKWSSVVRLLLLTILATLAYHTVYRPSSDSSTSRNFRRPKLTKLLTPQHQMADSFLKAIATRRTIYQLSNDSPISDQRIQELVSETVKHSPSSFNCQTSRAVILFGADHEKLWDLADSITKKSFPPQAYDNMAPKFKGFRGGHGTVMWFEDADGLKPYKENHQNMPFDQWSEHSSGMVQVHTWTALELEGLGCSLQHMNFLPGFTDEVKKIWGLPEAWDLKSQLVFGKPTGGPMEKTFMPIEQRVKVFGN